MTRSDLAIIYGTSSANHLRLVPIITFICVIKVVKPNLFSRLSARRISFADLCEETGIAELDKNKEGQRKLRWMMDWIRFSLLSEEEFNVTDATDPIRDFGRSLWQYNVDRERLVPIFCQQLSLFVVN